MSHGILHKKWMFFHILNVFVDKNWLLYKNNARSAKGQYFFKTVCAFFSLNISQSLYLKAWISKVYFLVFQILGTARPLNVEKTKLEINSSRDTKCTGKVNFGKNEPKNFGSHFFSFQESFSGTIRTQAFWCHILLQLFFRKSDSEVFKHVGRN